MFEKTIFLKLASNARFDRKRKKRAPLKFVLFLSLLQNRLNQTFTLLKKPFVSKCASYADFDRKRKKRAPLKIVSFFRFCKNRLQFNRDSSGKTDILF